MKALKIFFSLVLAALVEWMLAPAGFAFLPPPLILFALFTWFPLLSLPRRLGVACLLGIFLDANTLFPAGTSLLLLILLALAVEALIRALSNVSSPPIHAANTATLLFVAPFLREFLAAGLHIIRREPSLFSIHLSLPFFFTTLFWALVLPAFLFSAEKIYHDHRRG